MDGAGIAETGGVLDVVGGQPDTEPAAVMPSSEVAFLPIPVMVQRSPFLTQSVAVRRGRRSARGGQSVAGDRAGVHDRTLHADGCCERTARLSPRALKLVPGLNPAEWTPRQLRHSFVSVLSDSGVPVEEISQLVGDNGTSVTELVYRHQLRPVIQTGGTVMDRLFSLRGQRT